MLFVNIVIINHVNISIVQNVFYFAELFLVHHIGITILYFNTRYQIRDLRPQKHYNNIFLENLLQFLRFWSSIFDMPF